MNRIYYTLVVNEEHISGNGWWNIEFGSYSRAEVLEVIEDEWYDAPKGQIKILTTSDGQGAIDAAMRKLEGGQWS
jgi:hypothetical protein